MGKVIDWSHIEKEYNSKKAPIIAVVGGIAYRINRSNEMNSLQPALATVIFTSGNHSGIEEQTFNLERIGMVPDEFISKISDNCKIIR